MFEMTRMSNVTGVSLLPGFSTYRKTGNSQKFSREIPRIPKILGIPEIREIFLGKFPELNYLTTTGVTKTLFLNFCISNPILSIFKNRSDKLSSSFSHFSTK